MNNQNLLTVADIMQRKHFEKAEMIAGKQGAHRYVKWVHVMEVTEVGALLNGSELILSTGIAWRNNEEVFLSFLRQLIDRHVSGLCIELGTYLDSIPPEIVEVAEQNGFPLIVFHTEVRFIEITQDLHSFIISQHFKMISHLEAYSQKINQLLLSADGHNKILHYCQKTINRPLIQKNSNLDIKFFPKLSEEKIENYKKKLLEDMMDVPFLVRKEIKALDHVFAEILTMADSLEEKNYISLVLDRTATALAQHYLRELYIEEKEMAEESEWLKGWIEGEYSDEDIRHYLFEHDPGIKPKGGVVCFFRVDTLHPNASDYSYLKVIFRSVMKQYGFSLFPLIRKNQAIFILINVREKYDWKERLEQAIDAFKMTEFAKKKKLHSIPFGCGLFTDELEAIDKSYKTAAETVKIQEKVQLNRKTGTCFYQDLHIYRILSVMQKNRELKDFVIDYLQPVLDYDEKTGSDLLHTLKTYLACNGSKNKTAKELFIVRQSLYPRIEKLNQLLGNDFMEAEKRQAIEFAISSYQYFYTGN
ncbi:purine catabolism regulator [Bacillus oleivorans]|uniref:Purine catabolism regulator n=1 Tax=Bacillus oleivorans TaxID=1448271 RepID=A0A285CYE9_9BACI|nr:PucR family transcriptional regulator [Bacillus oleivorans]SNX72570.1 purine catabolism regulator [Bacillus oleivorans]